MVKQKQIRVESVSEVTRSIHINRGIDLSDINFDDPTPEETLQQQRVADEIYFQQHVEQLVAEHDLEQARELLGKIFNVGSLKQQRAWLKQARHKMICVKGGMVPLDQAEGKYVRKMYINVIKDLRKFVGYAQPH